MKTAELTGADLALWAARVADQCAECAIEYVADHAAGPHYVGRYDGSIAFLIPTTGIMQVLRLSRAYDGATAWRPAVDWSQGGQLIERHRISLTERGNDGWVADMRGAWCMAGPTPLIAAMRALVASVYGDTVPDEPA